MTETEGGTTVNLLGREKKKEKKIQSDSFDVAPDLQQLVPVGFAGGFGPSVFFFPSFCKGKVGVRRLCSPSGS